MSIRILLADDHKIVREGLKVLLENQSDMEVIAEAENGRTTAQMVQELLPDVVIMDISMPDMNGIEATRQITATAPNVKILALSLHSNRRFVVEMLKAGASGYLLKNHAATELIEAIRAVAANRTYLNHETADLIIKDYKNLLSKEDISVFSILTPRERKVLQLLAEGKTTKEISSSLNLSLKTAETHRKRIMDKLDIRSIAELTKYAIREGLTTLD